MKYKWKDKVRIKSKKELECISEVTNDMLKNGGTVMTIACLVEGADAYLMKEDGDFHYLWTDEMIEGLVEEETLIERVDDNGLPFNEWLSHKGAFHVPNGYEIKDENGNVINATKIVLEKKKKEHPKTYEECCKVLNVAVRDLDILDNMLDTTEIIYNKNLDRLLNSFRKLLICRDAYWKIAGEEMGLGKPWEPDWREERYVIYRNQGDIIGGYRTAGHVEHNIFEFPIKEMRDAFYDNFDPDIEFCKEFL